MGGDERSLRKEARAHFWGPQFLPPTEYSDIEGTEINPNTPLPKQFQFF
jgi:hypothetical protein